MRGQSNSFILCKFWLIPAIDMTPESLSIIIL